MGEPSVDKLLDLLALSGLVEAEQVAEVLRELRGEADGADRSTDLAQRMVDAGLITEWQSRKLLEGRHKGFFLGKYQLLDHLQAGGMSNIYLAEHTVMQRQVAIKVLPKKRVGFSSYLERFIREAQAVASLDHENIVKAYDVNQDGPTYYLVMEFVPGRDLRLVVDQDGPLDFARAAIYVRQAARGLAHAHASGVIHRDMKPANLLVDENDVVKILDLGLARFVDENRASLTVAYDEHVLGTADYLAPEQAVDSHRVDARADIYSLGCSLYFLLTGHPPFPEGSLPRRLMMHQKRAPLSILLERPNAPEGLVWICTKMMAKKPADRYQSANEVVLALSGWLEAYSPSDGSGIDIARSPVKGGSSGRLAAAGALDRDEEIPEAIPVDDKEKPKASGSLSGAITSIATGVQNDGGAANAPSPTAIPAEDEPAPADFLAGAESPAVSRLRAQSPLSTEDAQTQLQREKTLPIWVWVVLAGCCLLTLILALILVLGR